MRKVIIIMCSLVLVACGEGGKATSVVGDFLKANLATTEYSTELLAMDSTKALADSIIMMMRNEAASDKYFKKNIQWGQHKGGKLVYARVRILQLNDTLVRTFYLDPDKKSVVAFKMN
ncbi:MAG: hypothetical protein IJK46_04990 [Prevotella sp.]|nr:hypothetical protein [Prevotella sp.]